MGRQIEGTYQINRKSMHSIAEVNIVSKAWVTENNKKMYHKNRQKHHDRKLEYRIATQFNKKFEIILISSKLRRLFFFGNEKDAPIHFLANFRKEPFLISVPYQ